MAAVSSAALAEDWKPVPGEASSFYDGEFMRIDEASGLVVLRFAQGKANGPYKSWPPRGKSPILVYAVDCAGDSWIDLGMDYTGAAALPRNWRKGEKIPDISAGVGRVGKLACEQRDSLPKATLP
jgi:hypothetical protein